MKNRSTIDYKGARTVNICIIHKIGFSHTEAFREAAERIEEECRRREISCTTRSEEDKDADLNIVFGSHLEPNKVLRFERNKCLIINLERLRALNESKENEQYIKLLNTFPYIDFSGANTEYCKEEKIASPLYLYRPWFEAKWQRVINEIEKTWDVCLIGSITPRRQAIVDQLEQAGLSVTSRFNCYSYERDEVLSKSKICVNVHAYEGNKTAELWRLNYLAANRVRIISEVCDMEEGEKEISDALTQATYEDIPNCVIRCIKQETDLDRALQAKFFHDRTKEQDMKNEKHKYPRDIIEKPTLLNIGCGNSWREDAINIDVKSTGFEDLILNISEKWENINAKYETKRFGEIHLNENGFDAIEASCVLEHVEDLTKTLINMMRLLKPGGWLYLRFPHQDSLGAWQDPTHLRGMNENLIKYLNEWGGYLDLEDIRASPKWIKFIQEEQDTKINKKDSQRMGFVETILVKRIIEIPSEVNKKLAKKEAIEQTKMIGASSLREALHRRTYIQLSAGDKSARSSNKIPTVSLLTPTFGARFKYLGLAWKWINEQTYPHDLMEWVILTDTEDEQNALKAQLDIQSIRPTINVIIRSCGKKPLIGEKRNILHRISSGDILINFDDDDYYFPDRISHAVSELTREENTNAELAGCQYLPVFFTNDQSLWVSDPGENKACAGSFAYRRSLIKKTWYPSTARNGEEIGFTNFWEVPKIDLDPFSTMICIAHGSNTFDKDQLRSKFTDNESMSIQAKGITCKGDRGFFKLNELKGDKDPDEWQNLYVKACSSNTKHLGIPHELFRTSNEKSFLGLLTEFAINQITTKR